jgi:hypothetical protein
MEKIKVILTGATGMVGEGVLVECLQHEEVSDVLIVGRRSAGYTHPKIKEIIPEDFYHLSSVEQYLSEYNACFFCLGISSIGLKEEEYRRTTYDLTMHMAQTLVRLNPSMTFCYVSGAGTDSSEKGKHMWARIKGKTENDLMKLPFKAVYAFRPAFLIPTRGLKYAKPYYKYFSWIVPLIKLLFPHYISSLQELGLAMINLMKFGYYKKILGVKEILELAHYGRRK